MDKVKMLCLVGCASYACRGIKFAKGIPVPVEDDELADYLLGVGDGSMFEEVAAEEDVREEKDQEHTTEKEKQAGSPTTPSKGSGKKPTLKKKVAPKKKVATKKKSAPKNIHVKKKAAPSADKSTEDEIEV